MRSVGSERSRDAPATQPLAFTMKRGKRKSPDEVHDTRTLNMMGRSSYLSATAKSELLMLLRDVGIPEASSRSTLRRARERQSGANTPYGTVMRSITLPGVGNWQGAVQAPLAMLYHACHESPLFASLMRAALESSPSTPATPWRLIVYSDEISPQNPLNTGKDHRKVHAVYWSFLELGPEALASEQAWFTLAVFRSSVIEKVEGGIGCALRFLLPYFFGIDGHDVSEGGVCLRLCKPEGEGPADMRMLFARHSITIGDMVELKEILACKGHAGTKPCPCCRNVIGHKMGYAERDDELQPLTSLDVTKWKLHNDESVRAVVARLAAVAAETAEGASNARLEEAQQNLGWNHCPNGIISDERLNYKPISTLMFDWFHIYLVNGLFAGEFQMLLQAFKRDTGLTLGHIHDYLQTWRFPRQFASPKSVLSQGHFSATASESLSSVPVLAKFFRDVVLPTGACRLEVQSFLCMTHTIELLHNVTREGAVTPDEIQCATVRHLTAKQAAYGSQGWVFKDHQALHLAGMMQMHGVLLSCFMHERKHRTVKRFMKDWFNLASYEKGVLEELTLQHMHDMSDVWRGVGLMDITLAKKNVVEVIRQLQPNVREVRSALGYRDRHGTQCWRGDFILYGEEKHAGQLWHLLCLDGAPMAVVTQWEYRESRTGGAKTYLVRDNPMLIPASELRSPAVGRVMGASGVLIWPLHLRA